MTVKEKLAQIKEHGLLISILIIGITVASTFAFVFFFYSSPQYEIYNAYPNLDFESITGVYDANDESNRLYLLEQEGKIITFLDEKDVEETTVFLDLTNNVTSGGEMGLLGLAFHPEYKENGYFFVDYTADDPRRTIISRFKVDKDDPRKANKSSETIVLEVDQPYSNHNGGQIAFGPNGFLYIALGDGGSAGDPQNNAQDKSNLLGTILRIDIESGSPYAIPDDNPFKDNSKGYKEEIFAYGLRNPWRFSFDFKTERLWAADVGQNAYEEINIIEKGKNYGWNIKEGFHCYEAATCEDEGLTDPIYEYGRAVGQSITGGYVYRGSNLPSLVEKYIYGDFESSKIWALSYDDENQPKNDLLVQTDLAITAFGLDNNNELLICAYGGKLNRLRQI